MNRIMRTAGVLCVTLLAACEKNAVQGITGPVATARVKFFNFGVGTPGVNFYAGDTKLTATSSTSCTPLPTVDSLRTKCLNAGIESTTGTAFGGASLGGFYASLNPGQYAFTAHSAAAADAGATIATISSDIADGKAYSVYLSGTYNSAAKSIDSFIIEDDFPASIDWTVATVRFVNATYNATATTLTARNTTTATDTPIGGAVAYKGASGFVTLAPAVYDLTARAADGTVLVTRTAVSFGAGRTYTITMRGEVGAAATANRPFLDNTANR